MAGTHTTDQLLGALLQGSTLVCISCPCKVPAGMPSDVGRAYEIRDGVLWTTGYYPEGWSALHINPHIIFSAPCSWANHGWDILRDSTSLLGF